ncbi:MAG: sensor histidine kinase [Faecousia sp.]
MKRIALEQNSIAGKLYGLILNIFLPMVLLAAVILLLFINYNVRYSGLTGNITTASRFNQNFKSDVDLKMYYYVIGSSQELPVEEIQTARTLAQTLLSNSIDPNSRKAAGSVLGLCDSLIASIDRIQSTEGYDKRIEQLETNIYVITELIEEYMYTYLYHEAGQLAALQQRLNRMLWVEILAVLLGLAGVVALAVRRAIRTSRSITDPIDALFRRVGEIGRGDLSQKPPVQADDPKLSVLGTGIEEMAVRLNRQIELNRQEQIRLRGIELSLIQAQINPHFLYNTLDAIVWLIETGRNEQAEEMVTSLSTYFRSFLSNGQDIVTMDQEQQHIRSYLEIQQVRYKDILDYDIQIDSAIGACLIPKMTLQPLVENAIYHGIKPKRGKGLISVTGVLTDGRVTIRVSDTGAGMEEKELERLRCQVENDEATGFGLISSYKRLQLMYGADCTFTIDSRQGEGTTITIRIPFRTEEFHEENL